MNFFYNVNTDTGEIRTTNAKGGKIIPHKKAYYRGLLFKIYDNNNITIEGSLHVYWNNGEHNFNDFKYYDLIWVINDLRNNFNIRPHQCILRQLEIGLNINPNRLTNDIISHCFIHKTTPFDTVYNSNEGKYIQSRHSQYLIKIYNKRLQYQKNYTINSEILRFEIKYLKMQKLNEKGIYNLQDLLNYKLENFENDLLKEWHNVLFYDFTIKHKTVRLLNYMNPIYWHELISRKSKSSFYKHKRKLQELTEQHSEQLQESISELLRLKFKEITAKGIVIDPLYIQSIQVPLMYQEKASTTNYFIDNDSLQVSHPL